jgi:hypothetical protein
MARKHSVSRSTKRKLPDEGSPELVLFKILDQHKRTSPRPLDFLRGEDAVSVFVRYCWTALWALSFVPLCSPFIAIYGNPRVVLSSAFPRVLGSGILFLLSMGITRRIWVKEVALQWTPVFFLGGCLVYLITLEPFAPLSFLALLCGYWLIGRVSGRVTDWVSEAPAIVRKLVAAALRSVREVAILSAAGFGFVVMGQI